MSARNFKRNFFIVAGADAVKRIAEWIKEKYYTKSDTDDLLDDKVDKVNGKGLSTEDYTTTEKNKLSSIENGAEVNVQSDWNQTDTSADDFIKNKPTIYTKSETDDLLGDKVDKVSGKGLSTEDYTTAEKTKLSNIEAGAEVNVQSDWNQGDSTKDDYIKNKPTLRQPSADGTAGQYLKSNGNGNAPSWETMDSSPTANSTKAVTSGGVKTALDGKQASVTITTNANTPTDNDTVIMQDLGNTGTTSFLRRKLSTLWTYIKGKADEFYLSRYDFVNFPNDAFLGQKRYFQFSDDRLWGADQRFNVTWNTYDSETHENLNYTHTVANLFNHNFENYHAHPQTGEYDVIRIYPKTEGGTLGWTYGTGWLFIFFYNISYPEVSPIVRIYGGGSGQKSWTTLPEPTKVTAQVFKYSLSQQAPALYLEEIEITITGKTIPNDSSAKGCGVSNICYIPNRAPIADSAIVTKYGVTQSFYGNIIAPKFQTRGGTSSQYLRGDGSLTALSTTPTSGSTIPITSGGVYANTQSKLSINIPDNSGYQVMQLIADVTTSLTTPNYNIAGLVGYLYQWRYGGPGRISHRITAIGGHDVGNIFLFTDNNASNSAILPYLIKYNDKYYIALKKGSSSRSGIRLLGYWNGLLSEPINLYANSTASKWYSDSERTQEITFEITKSYERYPNSYLNFGGTTSQVVTGTGELKTIDSSVASGSSNLVTSGAVATAIAGVDLSGKVNLQPDFTASQIDYSAGNVGKWQKVLRFPEGADLVINMKKTAMGSDSTSTLWFSSSSVGDSYTSLFGNHSVRFVHDGGYVFLVLACRKSTNEPIESYTFQIAHSSVPMSDIVAVTEASPITATPKEPSIIYRAPITTGAVSFNVTNGAGSVAMANHNDFLGNMTSEATNGVTVTMSGATEGQIYRFVFTRNITGGVTFKQSNVAYCTISGDVNAGDTITLTAVSNTADGWLYEQESAGIKSSDGSVNVEYDGGVADLSVETPTIWNNSEFFRDGKVFEIGDGAISVRRTSDDDRPYVTMFSSTLLRFYVNNDTSVSYTYYPVTAGNTYHVKAVNYSTPDSELDITATQDGYLFYLDLGAANMIANNSVECYYMSGGNFDMSPLDMSFHTGTSTRSYAIITMQQVLAENLITLLINVKRSNLNPSIAFGYSTKAKGEDSIAVGQYAQANAKQSLALGFLSRALKDGSIAIGHNSAAFGLNGIAIGDGSRGYYSSNIAIGLNATADKQYSIAIGSYAKGKNGTSIAIGYTAQTNESNTIAIGALSFAGGYNSVAIGNSACTERDSSVSIGKTTQAGISSDSNDRPYLNVKEFKAVQFTDGGDSVMAKICETTEDVTISVGGNDYTLTPPAENRTLVVVNDAYAQYLYRLLSGYIKINGVAGYYAGNSTGADLSFEQLTGNYYAVWLRLAGSYTTPITSLSFIASYTDTNVGDYQVAVGSNLQSFRDSSVAVGHFLMSTRAYQTVIGSGNIPDYDALFIVGAGGNVTNARKNILTVDYREQLQVKGVRTQVARMTTSGTISGVNNIYLISSGCTVALPITGEEGQVLKVCAEGNCTVGGVALEAGKFREYVCAGGAWYTRE